MNFAFSSPAENLEAASATWLRDLEAQGCSPRTITGYALTVRDFIECFATEEDNPSAPSYADVLLWTQTFDARGLTQRTRQQYLVRLRAFFTWACEHGWYQVNPRPETSAPLPKRSTTERICQTWKMATPAALYFHSSRLCPHGHLPTKLRNRDLAPNHRPA